MPILSLGTALVGTILGDAAAAAIGWITAAAILALYVGVLWPVEYEVRDDELLIRYGFVRTRIPLDQIKRIEPSRNPIASPALSLDRIRIDQRGGGFALVSPADRGGFVRAIVESRRGIEIDPKLGGWSALSPDGAQPVRIERPPVDALEKDGRPWRIGGANEVSWIAEGVTSSPPGYAMTVAIPPIFEAYATFYPPGDRRRYTPGTALRHEQAVVKHLVAHTPDQPWWLGFLETGAHDVVFDDAPRVPLYFQWNYVLVEAGPEQALSWRTGHTRAGLAEGALPDLFFPADRSWLVSGLWDDGWTCIGGPKALIEALHRDPEVAARIIGPDDDRKPPELPRW